MIRSRASFQRPERLKTAVDFRSLLKKGHRKRKKQLCLYWSNQQRETSRFGFMISRKMAASAVKRNRAKRIAREFFRQNKNKFKASYDILLRVVEPLEVFDRKQYLPLMKELYEDARILPRTN